MTRLVSNFDWTLYKGNLAWLPLRTIFLARAGSHAYGTSLPTSDLDIRGVCIAPKEYYFGFLRNFEQSVQNSPVDLTVFELRKFMALAADCNPNVLEVLFTDPSDHLEMQPVGQVLRSHRYKFLSRKVRYTFSGYARQQMMRINTHYRWLKNPPKAPPMRAEFGLPERTVIPADQLAAAHAAIDKQLSRWNWHELDSVSSDIRLAIQQEFRRQLLEITQWDELRLDEKLWRAAANHIGIDTNFIELLDLERRYNSRAKEWAGYQHWLATRNPIRAELESKHSFDTKHAMHLVRLARMCKETLRDCDVRVKRPDAAELLEIRNGAWTYEQLVDFANALDTDLEEQVKKSPLPNQADRKALDALCIQLIEEFG